MSSREQAATVQRCPKCDADVRDGSLFCYNCGGRIYPDIGNEPATETPAHELEPKMVPAPGLRSARDIRRREKALERKPKTVAWEAAEKVPDLQLIVVTAAIIVFTVVVVWLVLYLT